jgi:hypothetical protein
MQCNFVQEINNYEFLHFLHAENRPKNVTFRNFWHFFATFKRFAHLGGQIAHSFWPSV